MVETEIIAHLTGQLTPGIVSELQAPSMMVASTTMIISLLMIVGFVIFICAVCSFLTPTKSRAYRSLLTDMYVVGTIKKLAKDDGLDLIAELKEFNKMQKKQDIKEKDIDSVIAENLKDKVNAKAEKDLEKIEED